MITLNLSPCTWRMATTLFLSVIILPGFLLSVAHRVRGLGLMRGLMDNVDVTPAETGTVVRMRRRLRREVSV